MLAERHEAIGLKLFCLLLDQGADMEMRDYAGQTPMHRVCRRGNREAAVALLARGASVDKLDNVRLIDNCCDDVGNSI